MKLEDFAKRAGCVVSLSHNPEGWGGRWQYQISGDTSVTYKGFRSERLAYMRFLEDVLGKLMVKELEKLLNKVDRLEKSNKELRRKN